MSLLSVVQGVCAVVGIQRPTSVFADINANRTMFEMLENANEMADRIAADLCEWSMLRASVTYTGNGAQTTFNLPSNYRRMLLNSEVWSSTNTTVPLTFAPGSDDWTQDPVTLDWVPRDSASSSSYGSWTIIGGQMIIHPAPAAGEKISLNYLDKNSIALAAGGLGNQFQNDADTFRLDERLLRLGMIYNWKAHKGSPYAEDMGTFGDAMAMLVGFDRPSPIIAGSQPVSGLLRANVAIPSQTIILGPTDVWP